MSGRHLPLAASVLAQLLNAFLVGEMLSDSPPQDPHWFREVCVSTASSGFRGSLREAQHRVTVTLPCHLAPRPKITPFAVSMGVSLGPYIGPSIPSFMDSLLVLFFSSFLPLTPTPVPWLFGVTQQTFSLVSSF